MFKCPRLQAIFEETKYVFGFSKEYMNSISDDISALEKLLIEYNPPSDHIHKITASRHERSFNDIRITELFDQTEDKPGDLLLIEEQIVWDSEKKRLFYVERVSKEWSNQGYSNIPTGPTFPFKEIIHKPLIETKFPIKKKIHPYLPRILESVAIEFGYVPIYQEAKSPLTGDDDEIPF